MIQTSNDAVVVEACSVHAESENTTEAEIQEELVEQRYGTVPNSKVRMAIHRCLRFGKFTFNEDNLKMYEFSGLPQASMTVHDVKVRIDVRPFVDKEPKENDLEYTALKMQLQTLPSEVNEVDFDVLDMLCMWHLANAEKMDDFVTISINDLCRLRGLKNKVAGRKKDGTVRRAGYTTKQRSSIADALKRVLYLTASLSLLDKQDGELKNETIIGRLIELKESTPSTFDWSPKQITYRLGRPLLHNLDNKKRQTALLPMSVLELDPYREAPEKRLSRYVFWLFRLRALRPNQKTFKLRTLLEEINEALPEAKSKNGKAVTRLESALHRLVQLKIINSWKYHRSDSNIFSSELNRSVVIEPPEFLVSYYKSIKRRSAPSKGGKRKKK
jgi:hypothetical protein